MVTNLETLKQTHETNCMKNIPLKTICGVHEGVENLLTFLNLSCIQSPKLFQGRNLMCSQVCKEMKLCENLGTQRPVTKTLKPKKLNMKQNEGII